MTEEKYKSILKGELDLLTKLQTDESYLSLSSFYTSNLLHIIDLKLEIAEKLFELEEK